MDPITTDTKETFYFIPHTHWEGAVFKTREEYLDMGLPNILRAIRLLKQYPDYRFVLDQACYVNPFLERYPQERATFQKLVDEGRLAIVGGTDVMLDVDMPGGESFVRQVLYGKRFFRQALGVDVTIGWQLDTFGHHAQMPQLLKLAGFKSFWFFRGVPDWSTASEIIWEGLDGSQIPAFWLPFGYGDLYGSPKSLHEFIQFMKQGWDRLGPFARGAGRVALSGADVSEPEEHVIGLIGALNRQPDLPFQMRLATPADFEAVAASRPDRPVLRGELNPIFQGAYSSRIELKQRTRELERLLTTAEKLGATLRWLGTPVEDEVVWRAWEPMLFNQTHDLMSGVMTDHVYDDTIQSYDSSRRLGEAEVSTRLAQLSSRIDTQGEGIALVVYNTLGWPRTDIALATIGFTDTDVMDVKVIGPDGQAVPVQLQKIQRHSNGALLEAEIAFIARDVPALGHAVYHVVPVATPSAAGGISAEATAQVSHIENESCRVEFDPYSGAITRLVVKPDQWDAFSGPANVVAQQDDHGDLWEPYQPLDGGSRIAMKTPHPAPKLGEALFSTQLQPGSKPGAVSRGPVFSEFSVRHSFGAKGTFGTTVRVYAGLKRIDIRTQLLNQDEFVRYRVLFPTSMPNGQSVHEIPYGASIRPASIEFPAQNWIDYSDGKRGIALLNRGLPGNNVADGTMMLSLLRSTRIVAYGFGGGYEPGMTSDSGLELGKVFTFNYSLVPHAGDWRQAGVYRDGMEFNHPLIVRTEALHPGALPGRWGLLQISAANVVVSTLKPGLDNSAILRVYEAAGEPAHNVTIKLSLYVTGAEEVNLMEDPGHKLEVVDNTLRMALKPFEIKTIKLQLA